MGSREQKGKDFWKRRGNVVLQTRHGNVVLKYILDFPGLAGRLLEKLVVWDSSVSPLPHPSETWWLCSLVQGQIPGRALQHGSTGCRREDREVSLP